MASYKFMVEIGLGLGNDVMQRGQDVAKALREVAREVQEASYGTLTRMHPRPLRDEDGNTVGYFYTEEFMEDAK